MRDVAQPKTVARKEVAHIGYVSSLEEFGEIKYIQVPVDNENGAAHQHFYFGVKSEFVERFCFEMFQIVCKLKNEEDSKNPMPVEIKKLVGPPRLVDRSEIFRECMTQGLQTIRNHLPEKYKYYPWCLVYSTDKDGVSLRTFYKKLESWRVSIIFIEDSRGHVFGGFASGAWEVGCQYTGSGECFLFKLYPETQIYPWFQHSNSCFMLSKHDHIEMGAG